MTVAEALERLMETGIGTEKVLHGAIEIFQKAILHKQPRTITNNYSWIRIGRSIPMQDRHQK
jgi:hypothetical protein